MRAGTLRHLITLRRPGSTQDAAGQPTNIWQDVATIPADIRYVSGLEAVRSDAPVSVARASIRIRWRTDVTADMQLIQVPEGTVYEVKAVLPDLQHRQYVDLVAEVVT